MIDAAELAVRAMAYAEAAQNEPMVWGESDCTAWARRWVEMAHGRRMYLPQWASRDEAMAFIRAAGSLCDLWSGALEAYGLREQYNDPEPGDIGIIDTHVAGQVGGIFLNHGLFAWRAEPSGARLLRPRPRTIIKTWALQ